MVSFVYRVMNIVVEKNVLHSLFKKVKRELSTCEVASITILTILYLFYHIFSKNVVFSSLF